VKLVKVDVEALKALVAKTRELDEAISDDRALTAEERKPFADEIEALVTALGAQGVDL
jgi:hypothetical protein